MSHEFIQSLSIMESFVNLLVITHDSVRSNSFTCSNWLHLWQFAFIFIYTCCVDNYFSNNLILLAASNNLFEYSLIVSHSFIICNLSYIVKFKTFISQFIFAFLLFSF